MLFPNQIENTRNPCKLWSSKGDKIPNIEDRISFNLLISNQPR